MHKLVDHLQRELCINYEQSDKPKPSGGLSQEALDRAFRGKQRQSAFSFRYEERQIVVLSGKHTGGLEVREMPLATGAKVRVTSLEQTLIDATVRPGYAGGVASVLEAYRRAREELTVSRLIDTLRKLEYVYPYHQAIGFYMERAGFPAKQLAPLKTLGTNWDFWPTASGTRLSTISGGYTIIRADVWSEFFHLTHPPKTLHLPACENEPLFCWRFSYPESTPCAVISLKTKHCPYSQAGRRGFESHLPLQFLNHIAAFCQLAFRFLGDTPKSLSCQTPDLEEVAPSECHRTTLAFHRKRCAREVPQTPFRIDFLMGDGALLFTGLWKGNQDLGPAGPHAAQCGPEEPVQPIQTGPGQFPLKNYDLLPEGENFKGVVAPAAEEHVACRRD